MPFRQFMKIFGGVQRFRKKQDIPEVTEFLVQNETFRNTVLGFHKKKGHLFTDLEKYLDKEILGKEEPLGIDSKNSKDSRDGQK